MMFRAIAASSCESGRLRKNASSRISVPASPSTIGPTMRNNSAMDATLRSLLAAIPGDSTSVVEITRSFSTDTWSALLENALEHHVFGVIWPHLDRAIVPETVWNTFQYHWTILVAVQESVISSFESIV